jgi:aminoglycoside 3-N-acetyltransferase
MVTFRELVKALRRLDINPSHPIIIHTSRSGLEGFKGGTSIILGGLINVYKSLVMPAFTYQTMLIPETGPADNGLEYGSGRRKNLDAQFFDPGMPVDTTLGEITEQFRLVPEVKRSSHPLLSFAGLNAAQYIKAQTIDEPYQGIQRLMDAGGWVLLIGAGHNHNFSIHLAERLAGRKQFIRWALTRNGVVECKRFPGCSEGFNAISNNVRVVRSSRTVHLSTAQIQAISLMELVDAAREIIFNDPLALLCKDSACRHCSAVRAAVIVEELDQEESNNIPGVE